MIDLPPVTINFGNLGDLGAQENPHASGGLLGVEKRQSGPVSIGDFFKGRRGLGVMDTEVSKRVQEALARKWPEHGFVAPHSGELIICAGGPSLKDRKTLDKIRRMVKAGGRLVCTVNGSHDHLLSLPAQKLGPAIASDMAVLLDPKERVKDYIKPVPGPLYFIASQCHSATLDTFEKPGITKFLYHHSTDAVSWLLADAKHTVPAIFSTVGLESILIGYRLGFRRFHLFGVEGSYRTRERKPGEQIEANLETLLSGLPEQIRNQVPAELHGYWKEKEYRDVVPVGAKNAATGETRYFLTNSHMACQADDLKSFVAFWGKHARAEDRIELLFHGDGLVPASAAILNHQYPWVIHANDDRLHSRFRYQQQQSQPRARQGSLPAGIRPHRAQWEGAGRLLHPHSGRQDDRALPGGR